MVFAFGSIKDSWVNWRTTLVFMQFAADECDTDVRYNTPPPFLLLLLCRLTLCDWPGFRCLL